MARDRAGNGDVPVRVESLPGAVFLSFPGQQEFLAAELAGRFGYGEVRAAPTAGGTAFSADGARWYGDLLYCPGWAARPAPGGDPEKTPAPYWARTATFAPFLVHFESIGEAARALKEIQRNWAPYQFQLFRRAALIQEKLPYINLKPRAFPAQIPNTPMGLYTLLDDHTMLAGAETANPFPAGKIEFTEDHENPPSRAYLKLQEALTVAQTLLGVPLPGAESRCFEAGACPGGWTWALRQLGARVFAVDRAPLAPALMADAGVMFRAHDAFTLLPANIAREFGTPDWVLSDVICYPARLFEWVQSWLAGGFDPNMVCTIKMQGAVDWALVRQFAEIPHSRVVHLNYNKHELTWLHCPPR